MEKFVDVVHNPHNELLTVYVKWSFTISDFPAAYLRFNEENAYNLKPTDIILQCRCRKINSHKSLLSLCSLYFENKIKAKRNLNPIIKIPVAVRLKELKLVLEFLYKGEIYVPYKDIVPFRKAIEILKIRGFNLFDDDLSGIYFPEPVAVLWYKTSLHDLELDDLDFSRITTMTEESYNALDISDLERKGYYKLKLKNISGVVDTISHLYCIIKKDEVMENLMGLFAYTCKLPLTVLKFFRFGSRYIEEDSIVSIDIKSDDEIEVIVQSSYDMSYNSEADVFMCKKFLVTKFYYF